MALRDRPFRLDESYESEQVTRDMLAGFLRDRGFQVVRDERKFRGKTQSQLIYATTSSGENLAMRVRLCWRRSGKEAYSAAQILQEIKHDDWEGSLREKVEREQDRGATHFLFVQREADWISLAALVPLSELVDIWSAQRKIYDSLISQEKLGRKRANPAENGSSPTLWLRDNQAPEVGAVLWSHPRVQNVAEWETVIHNDRRNESSIDYSAIGSDGAVSKPGMRSYVERNQRVRTAVLSRAQGKCESCGTARNYKGFLDVHHIFGARNSDRVWHCVAVCPNCHREAHTAPNCEEINARLLELAMCFSAPRQHR